jgi:hypothetical protein
MIMAKAIKVEVKFPSGVSRTFKSQRAVARMLNGYGQATGGIRKQINTKGYNGVDQLITGYRNDNNVVRNNRLFG